jgi:DNA ligase-1
MVFDWPDSELTFAKRYEALGEQVKKSQQPHLERVAMWPSPEQALLTQQLTELSMAGAEGLVLHRKQGLYTLGRSENQLKLKTYQDAEARVIGYSPGQGKYQGMVGALMVKTPSGIEFKIGSGLTDKLRQAPPPVGSQVTYRFNGLTSKGKPRFARFLRVYHSI